MEVRYRARFRVQKFSNSSNAWGTQINGPLNNVFMDPLSCPKGSTLEAIPVVKSSEPEQIAICLVPSMWRTVDQNSYEDRLLRVTPSTDKDRIRLILNEVKSPTSLSIDERTEKNNPQFVGVREITVHRISGRGTVWGNEKNSDLNEVWLGKLDCSEGDVIKAIVVRPRKHHYKWAGICTSADLWTKSYPDELIKKFFDVRMMKCQRLLKQIKTDDLNYDTTELGEIYCPQCGTSAEVQPGQAQERVDQHNAELHNGNDIAGIRAKDMLLEAETDPAENRPTGTEKTNADIKDEDWQTLDRGDTIKAKISNISNSGNGVVFTDGTHINIGPVKEDSVGESITIIKIDERFGVLETDTIKRKNLRRRTSFFIRWYSCGR